MVSVLYSCAIFLGILLDTVAQAAIVCGDTEFQTTCYGDGAYCCGMDLDLCCYHDYFYSFWWFWFIWFWVILLIVSCSIWICRRRRQRLAMPQYVIVEPQQTYGTVSSTSVYTSTGQAVPPTAPAYQQKPPPYSPQ